jgi:hypothetical protein
MAHLWKRVFAKSDHLSEAIEKAVEVQAAFERVHPVPFDAEIRARALIVRATGFYGAKLPASAVDLIKSAAVEWKAASKAAEDAK